jgi:hypothetical protein
MGSGRSATAYCLLPQTLNRSDETAQHLASGLGFHWQRRKFGCVDATNPLGEQKMGLELFDRTLGDAQLLNVRSLALPSLAFGDVCWH